MAPCMRCTTTAEEVSRPTHTATARLRRERRARVAMAAQTSDGAGVDDGVPQRVAGQQPPGEEPDDVRPQEPQHPGMATLATPQAAESGPWAGWHRGARTLSRPDVRLCSGLSLRAAQHARVVGQALGDARGVEVLEQRLGELARGPSSSRRRASVIAPSAAMSASTRRARPPSASGWAYIERPDAHGAPGGAQGGAGRPASRSAAFGGSWPAARRRSSSASAESARAPAARPGRRRRPARRRRRARARARRGAGARSRASTSARRPWRRAAGSSTTPPPRVSGGAIERTTTRSPARGQQRALQARLPQPVAEVGEPRRRLARAVVHVRAHPVARVAQRRARSRAPATGATAPGAATTSPRATSRRVDARRG